MREPGTPVEVRYSHEFEDEIAALDPDLSRREEVIRGVEWVLARTPLRGWVEVRAREQSDGPAIVFRADVRDEMVSVESVRIEE